MLANAAGWKAGRLCNDPALQRSSMVDWYTERTQLVDWGFVRGAILWNS